MSTWSRSGCAPASRAASRVGRAKSEAGLDDEDVRYVFWHLIGLSRRAQMGDLP